jgi:hypothetical protein
LKNEKREAWLAPRIRSPVLSDGIAGDELGDGEADEAGDDTRKRELDRFGQETSGTPRGLFSFELFALVLPHDYSLGWLGFRYKKCNFCEKGHPV